MARTKIDWADETINPITGCRNFGRPDICGDYCYAARMARRLKGRFGYPSDDPFRPTFHPDRLQEINRKRKKIPSRIFLNSMADWFGEGVDPDWIRQIVEAVSQNEDDIFFVLTKRPERMLEMLHCISLPQNLWWGVSVTKQQDLGRIATLRDALPGVHKFVSFEPLHGPISSDYVGIEWAIIGAESHNRVGRIIPQPAWIAALVSRIPRQIPVFMKENLRPHIPADWDLVQQFPEARP
jgi:protein gp37